MQFISEETSDNDTRLSLSGYFHAELLILKYQKNKFSSWKAQAEFKEAWREKKKKKRTKEQKVLRG